MDSLNIIQSPPTPLVAAALGLVDENQGSSHLVPGANLEHHPLRDRMLLDGRLLVNGESR
jgi:hypothetical protein